MKILFIMRHAKSDWTNADWSDFERPLNGRGLKAAPLMGELMKSNKFQPALIISSPARRAKETAALVKNAAQFDGEIQFDERIYEASAERLLEVIAEQDGQKESILLVGHNPGLESLLTFLTRGLQSMPTAALAVIDLEIDEWSEINSSSGTLRELFRPKEL